MDFEIKENEVKFYKNNKNLSLPLDEVSEIADKIKDNNGYYKDCFSLHKIYRTERGKKRTLHTTKYGYAKLGVLPESYDKNEIKDISLIIRKNNKSVKLQKSNSIALLDKLLDTSKSEIKRDFQKRKRELKTKRNRNIILINGKKFKINNLKECLIKSLSNPDTRITRISPTCQLTNYPEGLGKRICVVCSDENSPCICLRSILSSPVYIVCRKCIKQFCSNYLYIKDDLVSEGVARSI